MRYQKQLIKYYTFNRYERLLGNTHLKSTAVAEGKRPWLLALELVDGIEVDGRLLLGLTSRQEGDASDGSGDSAVQGGDGGPRDLLGGVLLGARLTSSHHVGLQEGALEEHVVVVQGLVDGGQNGLSDLLCSVQVVVTIGKNLSARADESYERQSTIHPTKLNKN